MKLLISLFLSFIFATNMAFAVEKNSKGKLSQTEQVDKKSQNVQDISFGAFQDYVVVSFEGRDIAVDDNNQAYVLVKFIVENKSDKPIKFFQWLSVYTYEKQIIHLQSVPLNFEQSMAAGDKININLRIPFNKVAGEYRSLFSNLQENLMIYAVPEKVVFADGQQINVAH
ncbi:hypothetical protein [uncultured Aggregatibacter sp.]|jgi:hypothetical protein|uniref:hypothetical protein n=1 Tax=uncultured Aggregatibacter sp. TaxID=470564 RepID=UPI0028053E85|nr:hypothetical protein [uncultured Aggregatibacter sp.]